ncbi:hypothetical protein [Acinetobacter ursingii]|nr:hypothetical protein [Acinetobacter ursingii]
MNTTLAKFVDQKLKTASCVMVGMFGNANAVALNVCGHAVKTIQMH